MAASREIDGKGWVLIAASTLGVSVCVIPVSILAMGVFIKPLGDSFGWGRAEISLALTILSIAMAVAMPMAGQIIDRVGIRKPMIASQILYGGALLLLPTLIERWGLAAFYATALWIGVVGSASSSVAYVKVLSGWFDKSRGLALGFAMSGVALGGAVAPVLAASLIDGAGWQAGFYGLALLPIVIGIPISLYLREAPHAQQSRLAGAPALPGVSAHQAGRMPVFWMLFVLFLVAATAIHGVQIHLAPLLSDRGLEPRMAALGVSFMFGISAIVRLVAGYAFDRIFAPWIGAVCFLCACIGAAMLVPHAAPAFYLIGVAFLGVGAGAESDLMAILVSRYFGLRSFGTIYGWLFGAFMAGSALGPFFLGFGFDTTGSYASSLVWCAAGLGFTTIILLALPRFPEWTVVESSIENRVTVSAA